MLPLAHRAPPLQEPAAPGAARDPSAPARYGAALALTAAAFAASLPLRDFLAPNVFILFFLAVVLAAWYGGRGPALLVAALAVPLVERFFLEGFSPTADALRFAVFVGVSLLIAAMRDSLAAARRAAEASVREAERSAATAQEQAAELEMQATELQAQNEEVRALADELGEAQRRLRASMERQLAEAQRLARLGSWEWDVASGRVRWSDEMYRVYGVEPGSEVTFAGFLERVHPDDRDRVRDTVERALAEGGAFELDHRAVLPDGTVRILHARGRVEADEDGRPARMVGTGQDVTEQREAEDAARRLAAERAARAGAETGRRRLEEVLEAIDDSFVSFDRAWRYTYVNRRAEETSGRSRSEMLGRVLWEVYPAYADGPAGRALRRAMETGRSVEVEVDSGGIGRRLLLRAFPTEDGLSVFYQDVTERREAERGLARLAAIVESSQDAIFSKTLEGVVESWNRGAERLYGYTAGEIVGTPVTRLAPPERADEVPGILARLARGEPVESLETVRVRKDGTRVDVMLTISPVRDGDGRVVGASTVARDITARKRAEASLRFLSEASRVLASSLDYRATLASVVRLAVPGLADFCTVSLVPDGEAAAVPVEVAHADPEKERLVWELARAVPPARGGATLDSRVLTTGEPLLLAEVPEGALEAMAGADEARRIVAELDVRSVMVVPLRAERGIVGLIGFAATGESRRRYDAADLALAEELARRAATAVENARLHEAEQRARREAEAAARRTARLQAVTAALSEARTPAEVADVVIGEGLASMGASAGWLVQTTDDGAAFEVLRAHGYPEPVVGAFTRQPLEARLPLSDALRSGEPNFQESAEERAARYPELQRDFGGLGFGAWASIPMMVEGRVIGGIGLSFPHARRFEPEERDFMLALARQSAQALERARLFDAERRARAEAEAANRAKFQFLTTMSHELRTPLNAIAGYVELLELGIRGPVTDAQRQDLERIRRSQTHLLGLINDVLNFARIEGGHVHFDVRDVALDEALSEVEALIRPQVDARGLVYEFCRVHPGVMVRADAEKLRQIVLNLLSNAVKFTPSGGRIVLECGVDDGRVAVRVRDTGVGIPADRLANIFEPFVQVNAGYTRTTEGTGLGLSISRDLARAMGGELTVESREGEGSVFTLTLPLVSPSASPDSSPADAS